MVAGLGDELERWQLLEERCVEARALAQRDEDRVLAQPLGRRELLGEDVHRQALAQARDGGVRVEDAMVVVEDRDLHAVYFLTERPGVFQFRRAERGKGSAGSRVGPCGPPPLTD